MDRQAPAGVRVAEAGAAEIDVDALPPTLYLMCDVLTARCRMGETYWTFPDRLQPVARRLEELGLVWVRSGPAPRAFQVWLTDLGRQVLVSQPWTSPMSAPVEPGTGVVRGCAGRRDDAAAVAGPRRARGGTVSTQPASYQGRMRDGTGTWGVTSDPHAFAEAKYAAGWRELTITRDGVEVGGIHRHPDTGKRTWWAEVTEPRTDDNSESRNP